MSDDRARRSRPTRHARRDRGARSYVLKGQPVTAPALAPGLHLVATPIGNLRDITLRALEVLAAADLIACEDTRVTRKLLDHYGIATPLTPYHDHNAAEARPKLLARLAEGAAIALVSDAGTPLISDPGFKLVRAAREQGRERDRPARRVRRARRADGVRRCRPTGSSSKASCRRRQAAAARAHRRARPHSGDAGAVRDRPAACGGARRSRRRPGRRARPRSAASSPSSTRRCGAATWRRWRATTPRRREPRGEIVIVIAPPDRASASSAPDDLDALLRARARRACRSRRRWRRSPPSPASPAATSISARWSSRRATEPTMPRADVSAPRASPRRSCAGSPAARAPGRVPPRPFGGKPRGGLSHRQGLPHPGAALAEPGGRDRHRRAPPQPADLRRGQGAREPRRCRLVGDRSASARASPPPPRPGSRAIPDARIRDIRFDAMLVAPGRIPRHITAAFDASS